MRQIAPRLQVHTVVLGSNNFRHLQDDPIVILNLLRDFLMEARTIDNSHVMVSTLVPSIQNSNNCDQIFLQEILLKKTIFLNR